MLKKFARLVLVRLGTGSALGLATPPITHGAFVPMDSRMQALWALESEMDKVWNGYVPDLTSFREVVREEFCLRIGQTSRSTV